MKKGYIKCDNCDGTGKIKTGCQHKNIADNGDCENPKCDYHDPIWAQATAALNRRTDAEEA